MTAVDPRVGEIENRLAKVPAKGESQFVGLALPVGATAELWNLRQLAREDVAYLLAELRKRDEALARVEGVHEPIDALMYSGPHQRLVKVCTGCGTDDGNWQRWPCPTIAAVTGDGA